MLVEVLLNPSARNLSLINSDVKSMSARHRAKGPNSVLHALTHLLELRFGEVVIIRNMAHGTYQQVSRVIGVEIENGIR